MTHRDAALSPAPGLAIAVAIHVVGFLLMAYVTPVAEDRAECGNAEIEPPEQCDDGNRNDHDGCSARCTLEVELREVELAEPPPEPEPEPPPPEPEPDVPPPVPEVKPPPPRESPKAKPKPKNAEPEPPPPAAAPPPPAIELPMDQTLRASNSGVTVIGGDRTRAGERGGQRSGQAGGRAGGTGTIPGGPATEGQGVSPEWSPASELYIARHPTKVNDVLKRCPAAEDLGISGVVKLKVQVRRDGSIRGVRVVNDGVGHGCGKIAVKALKETKFKPAVGTNGKPLDYELTYEYEFEVH